MKIKDADLMTVGELLERLQAFSPDDKIFFGTNSLQFYRLKSRGPGLVQLEFSQIVSEDEVGNVSIS
jgi:hypothetical protein